MNITSTVKRTMVLLALISVIPAMAVSAKTRRGMSEGPHSRSFHSHSVFGILDNSKLAQDLNLTESQIKTISEKNFAYKEKSLKLKTQLDSLHLQMEKAFSDDPKNSKEIISLAKKISDIMGQMYVQRIESKLAILKVLNDDQLSKLPTHRFSRRLR